MRTDPFVAARRGCRCMPRLAAGRQRHRCPHSHIGRREPGFSGRSRVCRDALVRKRTFQNLQASALYVGVDFGTSGARLCVIDDSKNVVHKASEEYDYDKFSGWSTAWERAFHMLLAGIPRDMKHHLSALAIDGTSATVLLVDADSGMVLDAPKLYYEKQFKPVVEMVKNICPAGHTVEAPTSSLAKLMTWHMDKTWQQTMDFDYKPRVLHQADWLAALLTRRFDTTDWNNCLKMGYDVHNLEYPSWMINRNWFRLVPPRVLEPGEVIDRIDPEMAEDLGLPDTLKLVAGTTDSIAAFLASGASEIGDAVTSLGTTMAIKLLSEHAVEDSKYGIYSHRLGMGWLVGGASNTGGGVLKQFFTAEELISLSKRMDVRQATGLEYYPLSSPGERFPVNNPSMQPRLSPRPDDDALFLQGMFEGIAAIEHEAYGLMQRLGSSPVKRVLTAGGGALNEQWTEIRTQELGVPVLPSPNGQACYGAALLAKGL